MRGQGRPFTAADDRINRNGRPPGPYSLIKSVMDELGEDGRRDVGRIMARALTTGKLRFPHQKTSVMLSADQWLRVALHFCPLPKDTEIDASAHELPKTLAELYKAAEAEREPDSIKVTLNRQTGTEGLR